MNEPAAKLLCLCVSSNNSSLVVFYTIIIIQFFSSFFFYIYEFFPISRSRYELYQTRAITEKRHTVQTKCSFCCSRISRSRCVCNYTNQPQKKDYLSVSLILTLFFTPLVSFHVISTCAVSSSIDVRPFTKLSTISDSLELQFHRSLEFSTHSQVVIKGSDLKILLLL